MTAFLVVLCGALGMQAQDLETINTQKPFEIHGSASAAVGYYQSNGFNSTRRPYSYSIMAAPVISVYGVQIPFNFTFTEASRAVNNPFAQFGINPYWKWIKGYFGWTNMNWSPTTLGGKTFLGAGIEINPSLFRFGAFYGRLNPALKENLLAGKQQQPQYKRNGFGFKLGVGNTDNYVDLIFVKGKDKDNSISTPKDTLNMLDITPAENAVFGIMSFQSFAKKKLTWQLDGAVSAFTRDIHSQQFDIGNDAGAKLLNFIIPPRLSSAYSWSAHTNITYKADNFSLGFDYNRIQPEYQSMGVDYLLNDQQKISLQQSFSASKKKVIVSFSESYQHDNLNKRKAVRTHRLNFSPAINLQPNQKFGATITFNHFTLWQQDGLKKLNDTTRIIMTQNLISFAPRYTIVNPKFVHNLFLVCTYQRNDDLNRFTKALTNSSTVNNNLGYVLVVLKWGFTVSPSFNVLYTKTGAFTVLSFSPTLMLAKNFWNDKISTSVTTTYTRSRQNKVWNQQTVNNQISIGYRITPHHAIQLSNSIMKNFYLTGTTSEYQGQLMYTYSF